MGVHELNKRSAELANCRCSFPAGMEEAGTFPVRVTFFCQSCESESVNWIAQSQRRCIARAVTAPASRRAF